MATPPDVVDHMAIFKAYTRVKDKFIGHDKSKTEYLKLRESISRYIGSCMENVHVTIYVDDVLDEPIIICSGKGENKLVITFDADANFSHKWEKKTWKKVLRDAWDNIESVIQNIAQMIVSKTSGLVEFAHRLAIKEN